MEKLPKQIYTSEFRQQAVAMITRDKLSVAEASRKLSISQKTLANWVKRARDGELVMASTGTPALHAVTPRNCGWSATF